MTGGPSPVKTRRGTDTTEPESASSRELRDVLVTLFRALHDTSQTSDPAQLLAAAYTAARESWGVDPGGEWSPVVEAMVTAPDVIADALREVTGQTMPAAPREALQRAGVGVPTDDEVQRRRQRQREDDARAYAEELRNRTRGGRNPRYARARELRVRPAARSALGSQLGGTVRGDVVSRVLCPGCGRRSVWWWVAPRLASNAKCRHGSCGWSAPLIDLEDPNGQ